MSWPASHFVIQMTKFLMYSYLISSFLFSNASVTSNTNDSHKFDSNTSTLDLILYHKQSLMQTYAYTNKSLHSSSMLGIKGYPMHVVYNRVPKSASTTLRYLFRDQAANRIFTIINKEIFVPFLLPPNVQQEVVSELESAKLPVLYERHMYFINFDDFRKPQPIYINVVRDPLQQVISAYYYSRQTCIDERRCYFNTTFLNETLDECVERRPTNQCIDESQGVSPLLPFFCGNHITCEQNKSFALQRAKHNIINYYTVVGVVEELYNFLFVLEHLMPKYFANICLVYMSNGMRKDNVQLKRSTDKNPSEATKTLLRAALANEYDFYEFIKERFHRQLQQILQTLTN